MRDESLISPPPRLDGPPPWDDEPMPEPEEGDATHVAGRAARSSAPAAAVSTPASILDAWGRAGALIHEATGFEALDAATGGGPVRGSRWYLNGAPDSGKTAFGVHIGHTFAARGISVGFLAVDEEPGDVLTRIAQRVGFERQACEVREPGGLARMVQVFGSLPIRFYGGEWTIEAAAADLAKHAGSQPTFLMVDSIQTAKCNAEVATEREIGLAVAVEYRVRAVRAVASEHHMLVLATSEMGRAGYRSRQTRENIDPLASGKWSSAIEFSARVLVSLRSVAGHPDVIEMELAKNKHGARRIASEGEALYLRIDRARQTLEECEPPEVDEAGDEEREGAAVSAAQARARRDAAQVARALAVTPGVTARELRAGVPGIGSGRIDAAVAVLAGVGAVVRVEGARRRTEHHLDGRHVPDDVLRHLPAEQRAKVTWARPPSSLFEGDGGEP